MRKTTPTIHVALELLTNPHAQHWGYDLITKTGIRSGCLYPVLTRMRAAGWLTDVWEDPTKADRSARRFYRLTAAGGQALELMVNESRADPRFKTLIESYAQPAATTEGSQ